MIIPTAEPFFFPGNRLGVPPGKPPGCLLVHGFTGSPKEMRWMGAYLAGQGCTVLGVRLAGHATRPEDMLHCQWRDWAGSVEDGYHLLRGVTDQVFIMGLSMGGVLALLFAAQHPVSGVVAMSTPYALPPNPRLQMIRWIHWIQPRVEKGPPNWHNPAAGLDHVDYPYYPTLAIAELNDLLAEMRAALPAVKVPVLLAHSRQDTGVAPENMERIYASLGSADKQMLWVEDSGHVITREPERQRVFEAAHQFIQRLTPEKA
jgi:carboxylesterase